MQGVTVLVPPLLHCDWLADEKVTVMSAKFYPKLNILQLSAPRKKRPSAQHAKGIYIYLFLFPRLVCVPQEEAHVPLRVSHFENHCFTQSPRLVLLPLVFKGKNSGMSLLNKTCLV